MCVQAPVLAAQLKGVFRTDVPVTIVHQDSTDDRSAVHHFGSRLGTAICSQVSERQKATTTT
eukprot:10272650-Prorocentrum_lima.AAC.1